jgi:hypothetical protein
MNTNEYRAHALKEYKEGRIVLSKLESIVKHLESGEIKGTSAEIEGISRAVTDIRKTRQQSA